MRQMRKWVSVLAVCVGASSAWAQLPAKTAGSSGLLLSRSEGTTMVIQLGAQRETNAGSSLRREWVVVRDPGAPARIDDEEKTGVTVLFRRGSSSYGGDYEYRASYRLQAVEPLAAAEVRLIVLDVFGSVVTTLSTTRVFDGEADSKTPFDAIWRAWSDTDAAAAHTSIIYVHQARTRAGKVYSIDKAALLKLVKTISESATFEAIQPRPAPQAKD